MVFFAIFFVSERITARERAGQLADIEQFRVYSNPELDYSLLHVKPGNVLVSVRDPRNLFYLRDVLHATDTTKQDVVVMTARLSPREHSFGSNTYYEAKEVFETYEQELFSKVVAVAEKEGKPVSLLVVPGTNVFDTIMATAQRLDSSHIVCGVSAKLSVEEQGKLTGDAWERLPEPKPRVVLDVATANGTKHEFFLGPHTPRMRDEDVELMHNLWLELTTDREFAGLHHYHIVALALEELQKELNVPELRKKILEQLRAELNSDGPGSA
jgi:nucleotide-binding universal stress UspA family protein